MTQGDQIVDALRAVYDPEIGINVVDLGLVYDVRVKDGRAEIVMTLTSAGCPLGEIIEERARAVLGTLPGIEEVDLRIVWDPPWDPSRMSEEALRQLGWA